MPEKDSSSKSFLARYVNRDEEDKTSVKTGVKSSDLSAYGINPLDETETAKKAKQLLNEAVDSQTQLMMD
jgi:hypothetical protein